MIATAAGAAARPGLLIAHDSATHTDYIVAVSLTPWIVGLTVAGVLVLAALVARGWRGRR